MKNFEEVWENNFFSALKEETITSLGDRTQYVGSSDIGGCLRKAFLSKVNPIEHNISQSIVLQRGHLSEDLIAKGLGKFKYYNQFKAESKTLPFKAHIDFLIEQDENTLLILECKSTNKDLSEPYPAWINQVHFQMHLLREMFPNKNISAKIFAINVNSGWKEIFSISYNEMIAKMVMQRANNLLTALNTQCEPKGEPNSICPFCAYKKDCKFYNSGDKTTIKGFNHNCETLISLTKSQKEIETKVNEVKKILEPMMADFDMKKVEIAGYTISRVGGSTSMSLDTTKLKKDNPELFDKYQKTNERKAYLVVKGA